METSRHNKTKKCPKGFRRNKEGICEEYKKKIINISNQPNKKTMKKARLRDGSSSTEEIMKSFKTHGIVILQSLNEDQFNELIEEANRQYHGYEKNNIPPIFTDAEYDIAKEYLEKKFPKATALQEIGSEVPEKQKVQLPVNMPSMDKIKPDTTALSQWCKKYKGPYVISCKLDGVSGLYYTVGNTRKMFTRGNGTYGQDVSKLLTVLSNIPQIPNVIVRGEFIIQKQRFEDKYKSKFANIRNMVAGLVNRKKIDNTIKDIDFVAYEVIQPILSPSQQMKFLQDNGFLTVQHDIQSTLSNEFLSNLLTQWRDHYSYEIDGIIVANDEIYPRTNKNPDHAFAFKMIISDQVAETHVTDVVWTASKDGYLKPRVRVSPVSIGGVKIEYATGFNGQFIEKNKIGIGSIIQLVRSGDVIPYIHAVTTPAEKAKMPEIDYVWTDTNVDIVLANKDEDPVVLEKQITVFFTTLEVEGLSSGNVRRLIHAGYNSIPKIIHMSESDLLQIEGFQQKMAKKLFENIRKKLQTSSLGRILTACGCFGRGLGEKKINPILHAYPLILTSKETLGKKKELLKKISGIGEENAKSFVENIPKCLKFLESCGLLHRLSLEENSERTSSSSSNIKKDHPLFQKKIIFTGFREKDIMKTLEENYEVTFSSSVSKNTDIIVVKTLEDSNKKVIQSKMLNLPVMTFEQFKQAYHLS
jgi:DNA ligase (NAD+)